MSAARRQPAQPRERAGRGTGGGPGRRDLLPPRDALLVLAAALALRALHWALFSATPFFRHPVVDGSFFDLWAQAVAAGREFQPGPYFKPPLYAWWLGALYRVLGHAPVVAYALQAAMGALTALVVLALGRLAFTPRVAFAGALVAALLPVPAFLELQLVAEPLTTLLGTGALLALLLAARPDGAWRAGWLVAAGLLTGLAALGRPNALLVLPVLAWWAWRASTGARRWRPALLVLVAGSAALAPAALHNLAAGGGFVPISANAGVNFWTGHGPGADGTSAVPVGVHWDDLQLRAREAGAGQAAAASAWFSRETWREIAARPGRAATILGRKVVALVGAPEIRNNIGPGFLAREHGVFTLARWWPGTWLAMPFALLGLAGLRRHGAAARLLALALLALALSVLPFFVNARFRAPLLPLLALFAAAGAADLLARWRAGGARAATSRLALLVALGVLVNVDWLRHDTARDDARDHYNLAMAWSARLTGGGAPGAESAGWRAQDPERADFHFRRAIALDPDEPDYPDGWAQLLLQRAAPFAARAEAFAQRGEPARAAEVWAAASPLLEQALAQARRAWQLFPRAARAQVNVGVALLWLGESAGARGDRAAARLACEEAVSAFDAALRIDPRQPAAAANRAAAQARLAALGG